MLDTVTERRLSDRRHSRGAGRRVTDPARGPSASPPCPTCRKSGVSLLAGESDGGWWFVCLSCDHLWDQRSVVRDPSQREHTATADPSTEERHARWSLWRRLHIRFAHYRPTVS